MSFVSATRTGIDRDAYFKSTLLPTIRKFNEMRQSAAKLTNILDPALRLTNNLVDMPDLLSTQMRNVTPKQMDDELKLIQKQMDRVSEITARLNCILLSITCLTRKNERVLSVRDVVQFIAGFTVSDYHYKNIFKKAETRLLCSGYYSHPCVTVVKCNDGNDEHYEHCVLRYDIIDLKDLCVRAVKFVQSFQDEKSDPFFSAFVDAKEKMKPVIEEHMIPDLANIVLQYVSDAPNDRGRILEMLNQPNHNL